MEAGSGSKIEAANLRIGMSPKKILIVTDVPSVIDNAASTACSVSPVETPSEYLQSQGVEQASAESVGATAAAAGPIEAQPSQATPPPPAREYSPV